VVKPAAPEPGDEEDDPEDETDETDLPPPGEKKDPETLSAKLTWLSASSATTSPVEDVVRAHKEALARAFRGNLAPIRTIILSSTSQADAEKKLKLFFEDWPAERIAGIVEQAMQICAAKGGASV
jgi:hypothetical protein